jgi:hypothetical protein
MTPARKKFLVVFGYAVTLLLCYGLLLARVDLYGLEVGKWLFYGLLVVALLVALIRFVKWVWNWGNHQKG